ncbi:MAG: tRNA (adenosine(37)-N6)-threonylcarbamoyltransferase complex transferase subunit TsaD [Bacteroidetes bacterium]|nr:tRNA (adenosine(37)-N6)-threonylcarbamoyltransferase complex transferase subunit TsaD [Bacteroidota bacterium]
MNINILAIESSCDETSAAVVINGKVVNNIIATQQIHEKYGGVVPELASRAHQQNIVPVVQQALFSANISKRALHAVAFTKGPGLLGSLLVGASFAKSLAQALEIPLIEVHHMQAHVLSHFIEDPKPNLPYLCLTASGGHTQIIQANNYLDMQILGETKDDAVGEAFDKAAKLLGLPYPGGPMVDKIAREGNPQAFKLPDTEVPGLDFSFSGIKTAFLYLLRDNQRETPDFIKKNLADLCASIQDKLIRMLLDKLEAASLQTGIKEIGIAGGVSANSKLREELKTMGAKNGWKIYTPSLQYCTDNAAMVAITAHFKYKEGRFSRLDISPTPRYRL